MININEKIQNLVSEILNDLKAEIKKYNNEANIDTKKNRVEIGSYKRCNEAPVLTKISYNENSDEIKITCSCWGRYEIPLIGDLEKEIDTTNVGKIDYIDYINIYKAFLKTKP